MSAAAIEDVLAEYKDDLLTGNEVAKILRRNVQTIRIYARTGKLNGVKVGPHYRYPKAEIRAYLSGNQTTAQQAPKPSRHPRYSK